MSEDSYTEVTSTSWFSRIGNALGGILIGIVLVIASVVGLFWNEGRAVHTERALSEGAGKVVTIDPAVRGTADGTLVHFSGALRPDGVPADPRFTGLEVPRGSLRLVRAVEMFQWRQDSRSETRKKLGGGEETITTYHYAQEWSSSPIRSSEFKVPEGHANPAFPVEGKTFTVVSATVGGVSLSGDDLSSVGGIAPLALRDQDVRMVRKALGGDRPASLSGGKVYLGHDAANPRVGDLRVGFEVAQAERISAIGAYVGGRLKPYVTTNGTKLLMVRDGDAGAAEMFQQAQEDNTILTWVLRAVGLVAMLIGFNLMMGVFGVLADLIPFIGDVVRFATGSVAVMLTALLGPLVIGVAWLTYRPVLGGAIILGGVVIAGLALRRGQLKARGMAAA